MCAPERNDNELFMPPILDLSLNDDFEEDWNDDDYALFATENDATVLAMRPMWAIQDVDEQKYSLEDCFVYHEHYLYSCDGNGTYMIASLWNPSSSFSSSFDQNQNDFTMTTLILRCHDNVRESLILPAPVHDDSDSENRSKMWFQTFLDDRCKDCGVDYRRVTYETCAKLVLECLVRMEDREQVLPDVEAEMVVRLYGLSSRTTSGTTSLDDQLARQLPIPMPAPNVHDLWMVLQRPEYYSFHAGEDVVDYLQRQLGSPTTTGTMKIISTEELFRRGMRYISGDVTRRERMYAALRHMALYHAVGGETQIASWLLWERASMMNYRNNNNNDDDDEEDRVTASVTAMESNVLFQLLVNRFFETMWRSSNNNNNQFPNQGEWGKRITHYIMQREKYLFNQSRGTTTTTTTTTTLPEYITPNGSIPTTTKPTTRTIARSDLDKYTKTSDDNTSIVIDWRQIACAICGSTTSKVGNISGIEATNCEGNNLFRCSQCHSEMYCCPDHQKLHWNRGGHKQDCTRRAKRN